MATLIRNGSVCCHLHGRVEGNAATAAFASLFERVTGRALPATEMLPPDFVITIGGTLPEDFSADKCLGPEGYAIAIRKTGLVITGNTVRALIYGVYGFFEKYLGCRWFSDADVLIPTRSTITLPDSEDFSTRPDFTYRRNCNMATRSVEFSLANGINNPRSNGMISAQDGGETRVANGLAHTIGRCYIPDSMFAQHPEYFPLLDGERKTGQYMQRCLTNPDVLRITIEKTREILAADPQVKYVGISQMDGGGFGGNSCECEKCRAIEQETESHSGLWIWFVNQVADAIKDEYPDVFVETLAYRFTRQPPKNIVPRPNVAICMCSIECCFSHELDKCNFYNESRMIGGRSGNKVFLEDLQGWGKLTQNIIIWDYVTNFHHYMAPHPNIHTFARNMQLFYDNGVRGYYPEGSHDMIGGDMSELKAYLLAKLAWDRFYDVEAGTKEFVGYYCGTGAPFILDYIHALNSRAEELQSHFCCYEEPNRDFFTQDFIEFAEKCFNQAEAVAENEAVLNRIRYWRLSVRYIRLACYAAGLEPARLWGEYADFFAAMDDFGVDGIAEHRFHDASILRMKEIIDKQLG